MAPKEHSRKGYDDCNDPQGKMKRVADVPVGRSLLTSVGTSMVPVPSGREDGCVDEEQ